MSKDDDQKAESGILKKPIHNKQTRKVSALPKLLAKSQRPDGVGASKIDDGPAKGAVPHVDRKKAWDDDDEQAEPRRLMTEEIELAALGLEDGGLFDDLFGEDDD